MTARVGLPELDLLHVVQGPFSCLLLVVEVNIVILEWVGNTHTHTMIQSKFNICLILIPWPLTLDKLTLPLSFRFEFIYFI